MFDINITIVNYKTRDDIDKCLSSLFCDVKNSNLNIIVHIIDNSNNFDNIKELLEKKFPQVLYINPGRNIGFGAAQNLGFKNKPAKYYLALNPDIVFFEPNTLKRLITFLKNNPKVGMIGPKLLNLDKTTQESCYRFPKLFYQIYRRLNLDKKHNYPKKRVDYYLMRDFNHDKTIKTDWIMGSFMLTRQELTDKIGFFDDRFFMYFEDCDWCRRTWQADYQVKYIHNITLIHGHRRQSAKAKNIFQILNNPTSRIHIKSWMKYFWKWGI